MKEKFRTTGGNNSRKSDNNIVPEKPANKEVKTLAEPVEGRALTKGNTTNTAAVRTQGRVAASTGLCGVRRKAQQDKDARFNNLFHHITPELLTKSFYIKFEKQVHPIVNSLLDQFSIYFLGRLLKGCGI